MNLKLSAHSCSGFSLVPSVVIGTCLFTLAVMAGLLVLSSCSTTPEGIAQQTHAIGSLSNAVVSLQKGALYLPPPANAVAEVVLAGVTAGLAAWNAHLHRTVKTIKNGNGKS